MTVKKMLLFAILALAIAAPSLADETTDHNATKSNRTEASVTRPEAPTTAQPGTGEQTQPVLEPGLAAIEANFGQQMQALKTELTSAIDEDQRDEIQQRMVALKTDWTLALANRQLELVRQKHDSQGEAELLEAISRITNPSTLAPVPVPRNPNAGIVIEGGAR